MQEDDVLTQIVPTIEKSGEVQPVSVRVKSSDQVSQAQSDDTDENSIDVLSGLSHRVVSDQLGLVQRVLKESHDRAMRAIVPQVEAAKVLENEAATLRAEVRSLRQALTKAEAEVRELQEQQQAVHASQQTGLYSLPPGYFGSEGHPSEPATPDRIGNGTWYRRMSQFSLKAVGNAVARLGHQGETGFPQSILHNISSQPGSRRGSGATDVHSQQECRTPLSPVPQFTSLRESQESGLVISGSTLSRRTSPQTQHAAANRNTSPPKLIRKGTLAAWSKDANDPSSPLSPLRKQWTSGLCTAPEGRCVLNTPPAIPQQLSVEDPEQGVTAMQTLSPLPTFQSEAGTHLPDSYQKPRNSILSMSSAAINSSRSSMMKRGGATVMKFLMDEPVEWQWLHKTGFRPYDRPSNAKIEKAYRSGESKVRVKTGKANNPTPMELFFEDMIQYDPVSGNKKQIRRLGPNTWWLQTQRFIAGCIKRLETGRPRREKFEEYQQRRNELRDNLVDRAENDVRRYKETGVPASIARSPVFGTIAMLVVLVNAVWISIDADYNKSTSLIHADIHFQVMENLFCIFFLFEILIRFFAFKVPSQCFRDFYFSFDFALVVLMIAETWALPLIIFLVGQDEGSGDLVGQLTVFRMMRLLRLTRMARVLRMVPELLVLLKGIGAALKSVSFTLALLFILLYTFGVLFKSLTENHPALAEAYFPSVGEAMISLLCHGTLLDNVTLVMQDLRQQASLALAMVFLLYIFLSSFTVLNMLIGILCQVVAQVFQSEQDAAEVAYLKTHLTGILECYDKNGDRTINRDEFDLLMENPELHECLRKFGTDVNGLVSLADVLFTDTMGSGALTGNQCHDSDTKHRALGFKEFLHVILRLRGEKRASVTDIVELREYVRRRQDHMEGLLQTSLSRLADRDNHQGNSDIMKLSPRSPGTGAAPIQQH
mmetsp:Transcript_25702/g.59931  ORF Transcript_25702/g.59931 Transcript_25702/m.59931 type:complete len:939 (+) Transcript_25702:125-2941(+)